MLDRIRRWTTQVMIRLQALERRRGDDRGASVVETVIIAAGFAALALFVMAAIKVLVEGKVAGINL
jgi:Flp pilus assembly protein TadG